MSSQSTMAATFDEREHRINESRLDVHLGPGAHEGDNDEDVVVEVQVRTILEEAWGEIEHDLVYKTSRSDPTEAPILKSGFVALSHRLHDADILVHRLTKRIIDAALVEPNARRAGSVAKQQRSLGIDTALLGLPPGDLVAELGRQLEAAEGSRLRGDHAAAYETHRLLRSDPRYQVPCAQRVLWSEMALDRLLEGETALNEGLGQGAAAPLLKDAWDLYEKAVAADETSNPIILLWRQSRIRTLEGRHEDARVLLFAALEEFERAGRPSYVRTPFYKAALKTRLGALAMLEYEKAEGPARNATLLVDSRKYLVQAVGDQRDIRDAQPNGHVRREWMLDNLDALNNLAYFYLRHGTVEEARATAQRAKETVDPAIWEQDIQFLDTLLAIELQSLSDHPTLGEFSHLDSLRMRILNILSMPGTYVSSESAETMLKRIEAFEDKWRDSIRALAVRG